MIVWFLGSKTYAIFCVPLGVCDADMWWVMEPWHPFNRLLPSHQSSLCSTALSLPLCLVQPASESTKPPLLTPPPHTTSHLNTLMLDGSWWPLDPGRVHIGLTLVLSFTAFFKIIYSFLDEALHWCFLTKQILPFMQKKTLATEIASVQGKEPRLEVNAVRSARR